MKDLNSIEGEIEIKNVLESWIEDYAKEINNRFKKRSRSMLGKTVELRREVCKKTFIKTDGLNQIKKNKMLRLLFPFFILN